MIRIGLFLPEQIKQGGWCCLLSWLFLFRFGVFLFLKSVMPVHSVPIKSNNLPYHWGVLLPGLHKGLQSGSRQGCPLTAMDSSRKRFREGVKVWNVGREVVNTVAFRIIRCAAASGRPCSEPSERTFYVKCCCFLPFSLFKLCWVSFSKLTHLTLQVHLSPPSYAINSLLSYIVGCWQQELPYIMSY